MLPLSARNLRRLARVANRRAGSGRKARGAFGTPPMAEGSGWMVVVICLSGPTGHRGCRRWWPADYSAGPLLSRLATSRSHLRWWRQAQPPVTLPRVIARSVPRVQIAA